ncbi:hypothetical protein RIF29_37312 [Crotalaria pallida]|uniref:KIB1-4 beta-propeller domain-containing protein n=1 Tax=Crotalaria pallida TaxID=3830 RepID=A0AAN9EIU7_CROPI
MRAFSFPQDIIMLFDRELPLDLWVCEIVKHLDSPKDYLRFRATCKSWNLNLPKIPNHMKLSVPQLMLPFGYETDGILQVKPDFFHSSLPVDMPDTLFRGSGFGWLISVGLDGLIRMLNPHTKAQFNLPPMSTIPNVVAYNPDVQDEEYTIKRTLPPNLPYATIYTTSKYHIQEMNIKKIIISSPPPLDHKKKQQDDFMAIAIYGEHNQLAFCKLGDNKWREFSTPGERISYSLDDAIFYEGKIYGVGSNSRLVEFDLKTSSGSVTDMPHRPKDDPLIQFSGVNNKFLVCSDEGDLLMVVRYWTYTKRSDGDGDGGGGGGGGDDDDDGDDEEEEEEEEYFYKTSRFGLYKLDKRKKKWRRISSLGDSVLVVGLNSSVCMLPFIDGNGKWVRNCIYFCDNNFVYHGEIVGGHDVGVFNLEDERVEELFPNVEFIFPPPVWLFSQNVISY